MQPGNRIDLLMKDIDIFVGSHGDEPVNSTIRSSVKILGNKFMMRPT